MINLDKYDMLPLECDGLTRVLHRVLLFHSIPHRVIYGILSRGESSLPHYWIELEDGKIVDYRARMWFSYDAPHGVFNPNDQSVVNYQVIDGNVELMVLDFILDMWGVDPVTMEIK